MVKNMQFYKEGQYKSAMGSIRPKDIAIRY